MNMTKLMLAVSVATCAIAAEATTYWWAGASGDSLSALDSWRLENGAVPTSRPGRYDTVVFTNDAAISVSKPNGNNYNFLNYRFEGANVTFNPCNDRFVIFGGGGISATGSGTYLFPHTLEGNNEYVNNAFTEGNNVFTIDVASGATVEQKTPGSTKISKVAEFVKKGAGTFKAENFFPKGGDDHGVFRFEEGVVALARATGTRNNWIGELQVCGTATKRFDQDATALTVTKYTEDADAAGTLTFKVLAGNDYVYTNTFNGPYDARFSAGMYHASGAGVVLEWNPGTETNTMTVVKRAYTTTKLRMVASSGKLRFAEGACAPGINAIVVRSGAALEIAPDAGSDFSGTAITLHEGGRLNVCGDGKRFKVSGVTYNGTAIPVGCYGKDDFAWLEGNGVLIVGAATPPPATFWWTGAADAQMDVKTNDVAVSANWLGADGETTGTPATGDTAVFTNGTALTARLSKNIYWKNFFFNGKGVYFKYNWPTAGASPYYTYFQPGGRIVAAASSGTHKFGYSVLLDNAHFAAGEEFTVDAATGSEVQFASDLGGATIGSNATLVKTGSGTLTWPKGPTTSSSWGGTVRIEGGTFYIDYGGTREFTAGGLEFAGPSSGKVFYPSAVTVTIKRYRETPDAEGTATIKYNNNTRIQVFNCSEDTRLTADLMTESTSQYVGFKWQPTDATKTLTIAKRQFNRARTRLYAAAGTMRFAEGAGVRSLNLLDVSAGATLAIASDASDDFTGAPLTLAAGSKLRIEKGALALRIVRVGSVTYDGTAIPDGRYTASDYPDWLEGDATLEVGTVAGTAATWTGGGGADTAIDNADNWGGVLPDLTSGTLVATFPADATVTVPAGQVYVLRGIVVDPSSTSAHVNEIGGAGMLWLGSEGISCAGGGRVRVNGKVVLAATQTWNMGSSASAVVELTANAEIAACTGAVWQVSTSYAYRGNYDGPRLLIRCGNPGLWDSTISVCTEVFADGALGPAGTTTKLNAANKPRWMLFMHACALLNATVSIPNLNSTEETRAFTAEDGCCTFKGLLDIDNGNATYFDARNGGRVVLEGGYKGHLGINMDNKECPHDTGYDITITNKEMVASKLVLPRSGSVDFFTSGNFLRRGAFIMHAGATLSTHADEAFLSGNSVNEASGVGFSVAGTWNVFTTRQTVQILTGTGAGIVTGESPATVTVNANTVYVSDHGTHTETDPWYTASAVTQQTDRVSFRGGVSLRKTGPYPHYCGGVSTSTGDISVDDGRLVFKDGASWRTAGTLTISDAGVFEVEGNHVLTENTSIVVTGGETARIVIPSGMWLKCASLTVNGALIQNGTVTDGVVTGGGRLEIGHRGTLLLFR